MKLNAKRTNVITGFIEDAEARWVSIVNLGANEEPFAMLKEDEATDSILDNLDSPYAVLAIEFPENESEEEISSCLSKYDPTTYTLVKSSEGKTICKSKIKTTPVEVRTISTLGRTYVIGKFVKHNTINKEEEIIEMTKKSTPKEIKLSTQEIISLLKTMEEAELEEILNEISPLAQEDSNEVATEVVAAVEGEGQAVEGEEGEILNTVTVAP